MPLTITTKANTVPAARVVPAKEIQDAATAQGNPFGSRAIAITKPKLHHETKELEFETVTNSKGTSFRFKTGTLPLTLSQEIIVSDALNECQRKVWLTHEQAHVTDNEAVLKQMEAELKKDAQFSSILISPSWTPVGTNNANFKQALKTIGERIGFVFKKLTTDAATARDTDAEYKKVEAEVKKQCP